MRAAGRGSGLFSKPSSATLATNIAGFAVIRQSGLQDRRFFLAERERAHRPRLVQRRAALLEHGDQPLRFLVVARRARPWCSAAALFSTVARSARHSSVWITSMSEIGSTLPATWMTFSSSKQRTTLTIASVSRMCARNWLPRPSPLRRAGDQPGDVDELDDRRDDALGLDDRRQRRQPRDRAARRRRRSARSCRTDSSRRRCRPSSAR